MKANRLFCFALLLLASLVALAEAGRDFYKILGVDRRADDDALKKAYRKLAKKWHPDRQTDEKKKEMAKTRFQDVAAAYETLSDPEKRRIYDQVGEDGLKGGGPPPPGQGQGHGGGPGGPFGGGHPGGGGGGHPGGFQFSFGGDGAGGGFSDPMDLFSRMFGGGGMGGMGGMGMGGGGGGPGMRFGGGPGGGPSGGGFPGGGFPGGGPGGPGPRGRAQPSKDLYASPDCKEIVKLDASNFLSLVGKGPNRRGNKAWLLEFYSPSCGHCAKLAPTLCKLSAGLGGAAKVGVVDCTKHPKLCQSYNVKGYPTLHLLKLSSAGSGNTEYRGDRSGSALKQALTDAVMESARVATVSIPKEALFSVAGEAILRAKLEPLLATKRCSWPSLAPPAPGAKPSQHGSSAGCVLLFSDKSAEPSLAEAALSVDSQLEAAGNVTIKTAGSTPTTAAMSLKHSFIHVHLTGEVATTKGKQQLNSIASRLLQGPSSSSSKGSSAASAVSFPAAVLVQGASLEEIVDGGEIPASANSLKHGKNGSQRLKTTPTFKSLHQWLLPHSKAVAAAVKQQAAAATAASSSSSSSSPGGEGRSGSKSASRAGNARSGGRGGGGARVREEL